MDRWDETDRDSPRCKRRAPAGSNQTPFARARRRLPSSQPLPHICPRLRAAARPSEASRRDSRAGARAPSRAPAGSERRADASSGRSYGRHPDRSPQGDAEASIRRLSAGSAAPTTAAPSRARAMTDPRRPHSPRRASAGGKGKGTAGIPSLGGPFEQRTRRGRHQAQRPCRAGLPKGGQHLEQCSLRSPELAARVEEDDSHKRRGLTVTWSPGRSVSSCFTSISRRTPFTSRVIVIRLFDPFSVMPPASEIAVKIVISSS